MDTTDLRRYKKLLLTKQRELLARRAGSVVPLPEAAVARGDSIDQASAETEVNLQVRLRQTNSRLLGAIEEALTRIEQGTYGLREACGPLVATARLEPVPWTRLCRDCKEQQRD